MPVLVLGEDLTQTAPLMALNLRRMRYRASARIAAGFTCPNGTTPGCVKLAQRRRPALYIATPYATRLADEALRSAYATPDELVGLGYAVLAVLDARNRRHARPRRRPARLGR